MGTSGSFKGSGGKDAKDLRDAISGWLDDVEVPTETGTPPGDGQPDRQVLPASGPHLDPSSIIPILRLWGRGSGGGPGGGGVGGGGGGSGATGSGGGRSSGGVQRTVGRVAGPAGRASSVASGYAAGNRDVVEAAGLDYDELRRLNDPLEIGHRIVEASFETPPDGTIEDAESRLIVAELVAWIIEPPDGVQPSPDEMVRFSIELMIEKGVLTEVGDTIRKEKNQAKRLEAEEEIRRSAHICAARVELGGTGATPAEIARAIQAGVDQLSQIYGEAE